MDSNNNIEINGVGGGLITDLNSNFLDKNSWSSARNAVSNTHLGDLPNISNEPSTLECVTIPYTPIGFIRLLNNRWAVFSTNNTQSEIGIFDELRCEYSTLVRDECLNFDIGNLVEGKFREMVDCTETIYWTDAGRNPRRYLNLSKIPYQFTIDDDVCQTKVFTDKLDCNGLLVEKNINIPCITVERGVNGSLTNGTYQFAIAYSTGKSRITDYYSVTNPHKIWSHNSHGYSLTLTISNLDREFDEYELIVIACVDNGAKIYKRIGFFSTGNSVISVSSINRPEYINLSIEQILIPRPKYPYADGIESNDQYLLWSGVRTNLELNYQLQAMKIVPKYIVHQLPADYYKKGGQLVGYARDEQYSFGIQWLYTNGEWSNAFHIPGRKATSAELGLAAGRDVYEVFTGSTGPTVKVFQVDNTASTPSSINLTGDTGPIAKGDMAYWQSSDHYPDNEIFGDDKCTPIRHPKFPDECKTSRFKTGGLYINALGIQFENIEHPKDSSGEYRTDIIGYRIVRGDRDGNESIVSSGIFTNIRSYTEQGNEVIYSNYPVNDLRPDTYLSNTATFERNGENGFSPLTGYSKNEFSYYSPETLFNRVSLGEELRVYSNESCSIEGFFENVYKHPRAKLLTEFDLYFALIIGALDGYYATVGKTCVTKIGPQRESFTFGAGIPTPSGPSLPTTGSLNKDQNTMIQACDDALAFTTSLTANPKQLKLAERILRNLAKIGVFAYFAMQTAQKVLDIILQSSGWQDYAKQFNSHAFFNNRICADKDYRRRKIDYYQYISDGLNTVNDKIFNNYKREETVYLKLNDELKVPDKEDTTRGTISDFDICNNITSKVSPIGSVYYGSIKRPIPNQYGSLDSIVYLDTGHCVFDLPLIQEGLDKIYKTDPVFGGDTYVTRMTVKRSQHMFSEELKDGPDGYIFNYNLYRNIGHPRYWIDTTPYDVSEVVNLRPRRSRTPRNKHNLDCGGNNNFNNITVVKDRYFYITNNGVLDFFVESKYNLEYRDWKLDHQNFYSATNSNLTQLFRSDKIEEREEFVYDSSYFKKLEEGAIYQQSLDFDPEVSEMCSTYLKNRVIYSLPAFEQRGDNWLIYLAENRHDFATSDFGNLTAMKAVDNQRIMFLFDKSAPYVTPGRDELQLDGSGKKITLGDGGLFERDPRPIAYTDYFYASSQSKWAFVNTQYGTIYPSQRQGRIFQYAGNLNEISNQGNSFWFKNYLPSKLLQEFPNYKHGDNLVKGVGLSLVFDNTAEMVYITKKDFSVKDSLAGQITYNVDIDKFILNSREVDIHDLSYFDDCSWTISYDPKRKNFISYHDWHPEWLLQSELHFMSVKDKTIWKHNQRCDSFCNFYNIDYPFEIEPIVATQDGVTILRSFEYYLDAGRYYSNCADFHTILDENFDYALVSNQEQHSGLLHLFIQSKNNLAQIFDYPAYDPTNECFKILYNKEEQRYRFNMFDDIVRDRGEFDHKNIPIILTEKNGYKRNLNSRAINYFKPVQFRKKFRNTYHKILLGRKISGDKKFIIKWIMSKIVQSPR